MPDNLLVEQLTSLLEKIRPGSQFVRAWTLKGGISASMTAFEILDAHWDIPLREVPME